MRGGDLGVGHIIDVAQQSGAPDGIVCKNPVYIDYHDHDSSLIKATMPKIHRIAF